MHKLVVVAALVVGALALPIKREDDYNHWVDAYGADNEDVAGLSEEHFQHYRLLLLRDLGGLDYIVSSLLNPYLHEELKNSYGHIVLSSIHWFIHVAGTTEKDLDSESKPQEKGCEDKSSFPQTRKDCDGLFGHILWNMRETIKEAASVLNDPKDSRQGKLKAVKTFVDKIADKGPCVLELAVHCYMKDEVAREMSGNESPVEKANRWTMGEK
ncbi:uncharacterized protein LOC134257108 [Saccostrea cucullata]|uniref:uncharacterized protein LOC134257108 n=1 Tax=Saccostrea cuccullata TaxID=36930 RepID=UPI002ED0B57E